jgi:dTDP-4-dehydrorhamnose reductase
MVASIKEMKWAITGGSGQLARSLVRVLDSRGDSYVAWRKSDLDVVDKSSIKTIKAAAPKILINCAAWTNVDGAEDDFKGALEVNRDGAQNCAISAKDLGIPLIHISTDYVFSGDTNYPWKVNDLTDPTTKYGTSKLLGETAILETYPSGALILRTAWLYGPFGKNFAKTIIKKALTTKDEIKVVNDQVGQPTSTIDLAHQIINLAETGLSSGIYHGSNSGQATWWEFACALMELSGENSNRISPVLSKEFQTKTKRPEYSVLDHSEWQDSGVSPMRPWRTALEAIYPEIHKAVERELANG